MQDKLIMVTMTYQRKDGSVYMRSAAAEAAKWDKMNMSVATIAYAHSCNPDWQSVQWQERELLASVTCADDCDGVHPWAHVHATIGDA